MKAVAWTVAALLFAGYSGARVAEKAGPSPPAIVTVDTIPEVSLNLGDTTSVAISITVAGGYHVQANPASGEFLIPLELRLDPVDGLPFGNIEYPKAIPHRLEGSDDDLQTYAGTFAVTVSIAASRAGTFDVNGSVRYQACDDKRCLFPSSVPFAFKIVVTEKSSKGGGP